MVKFRFSPGRTLTGAVAAAALTAFAASASAQQAGQGQQGQMNQPGMQQQQMMTPQERQMMNERMQQQMQAMTPEERRRMQERMQQGMGAQQGTMPQPGQMQQGGGQMGTMQNRGAMQQGAQQRQPGMQGQQQSTRQGNPGGASTQERLQMWNMDRYIQMHQAIAAHENCRDRLSQPAMRSIVQRIESQAGEPPSPGRKLAIQDDAQFNMKEHIARNGCFNPRVRAALEMFDQELAPAAHQATAAMPER